MTDFSPGLRRVAGVLDPSFKGFAAVWDEVGRAAKRKGIELTSIVLHELTDDIESAVGRFAKSPSGGLIVLPTAINNLARSRIFAIAAKHRLPAIYPFRHYAVEGGLMAYGFRPTDLWRRSANYVDRIFKGENPADLPVQAPTTYELVINRTAMRQMGLKVPEAFLLRADEMWLTLPPQPYLREPAVKRLLIAYHSTATFPMRNPNGIPASSPRLARLRLPWGLEPQV